MEDSSDNIDIYGDDTKSVLEIEYAAGNKCQESGSWRLYVEKLLMM